ncbi:MAG: class I SAM-dependent methyltransferase [Leptospirales bacterium]
MSVDNNNNIVKCPLCESSSCILAYDFSSSLYICASCGLYFSWPHTSVLPESEEGQDEKAHWGGRNPYEAYAAWREFENKRVASVIVRYGPFGKILEIGYGTGALTSILLPSSEEYWGIEPYPEHYKETREKLGLHPDMVFCTTAEKMLENSSIIDAAGSFNAIVMVSVFEHLSKPIEVLKACNSLLKPGGLLFLSTPDSTYFKYLVRIRRLGNLPLWSSDHISFFNEANLESAFSHVGFSVVEEASHSLMSDDSIQYFYRKSGSRMVYLSMKTFSALGIDRLLRITTLFYVLRKY